MTRPPIWKCRFADVYRPEPRLMIEALIKARKKLERIPQYSMEGICAVLPGDEAGLYLRRFIMESINTPWLSGWIRRTTGSYPSDKVLRKARLGWIDWMIAQLEQDIKEKS